MIVYDDSRIIHKYENTTNLFLKGLKIVTTEIFKIIIISNDEKLDSTEELAKLI